MARILRGEVYWADLNPVRGREQAGLRPIVVISHEPLNQHSGTVIALAITSQPQRAGFPLSHEIESLKMPKPSWVKIGQIRTLSIERLGKKIGSLNAEEVSQVVDGLFELVG
ncbi:MAG TPA: type II toxin-antitoxin system PemK/MazF family toxin [Methylomirabilota bacterium]|nr:type II toxin-antitoxin system PemK/MazF family toxin [Methylomirabilota bacterium]